MKFKEFVEWCNERACDGAWSMPDAQACICIINEVNYSSNKKKEREKKFQEILNKTTIVEIINEFQTKHGLKTYEINEPEPVSIITKVKDWFTGHGRY